MLDVIAPAHDLSWLSVTVSNLKRLAKPSRDRLAHMVDPRQLYHLGLVLMKEAIRNADQERYHVATMGRDGLMIASLVCCPVRIRNFTQIAVGKHLLLTSTVTGLLLTRRRQRRTRLLTGSCRVNSPPMSMNICASIGRICWRGATPR